MNSELQALKAAHTEMRKLVDKYEAKETKERAKAADVYITIQGEKIYTESEIMDMYSADMITSAQCDRYIDKLTAKKEAAGADGETTKSGRIKAIFENFSYNLAVEIKEIEAQEEMEG